MLANFEVQKTGLRALFVWNKLIVMSVMTLYTNKYRRYLNKKVDVFSRFCLGLCSLLVLIHYVRPNFSHFNPSPSHSTSYNIKHCTSNRVLVFLRMFSLLEKVGKKLDQSSRVVSDIMNIN